MNSGEQRFIQEQGIQVFTGTELLLKGALEAGAGLLTGYPGSPVADFFNLSAGTKSLLKDKGIVFHIANNEALGVARLNGSQMDDIRAMVVMKSVGVHVASDGLALGNLSKFGHKGGAIVVMGDDPWSDSTQIPSDSRFLSRHLHMPIIEPSSFQEVKDWIDISFQLSKDADLYIAYLLTTNIADGGGSVTVKPNRYPQLSHRAQHQLETRNIPVEETVVLSPRTAVREESLKQRFTQVIESARRHKINQIFHASKEPKPFGFITSGLSYQYLEHALRDLGLEGCFPILKLGMTYPVDPQLALELTKQTKQIIVIEEKRSFIEDQVAEILRNALQTAQMTKPMSLWGKSFPYQLSGMPETRGLNVSIIIEKIGALLRADHEGKQLLHIKQLEAEERLIEYTSSNRLDVHMRTPTFCPGCPHRDSSSVFKEIKKNFQDPAYMRKKHRTSPVDLLFHGDTGCYTMLMFEPNQELMHNYSGMGLGVGTGAGIDPFIKNKQIAFMGDSTFFHSGMIAISDAIKHDQDITIVVLDNDTTAMTGHQPTPSQDKNAMGEKTYAQRIDEVVRGMSWGSSVPVYKVDPSYRDNYMRMMEEIVLQDGVKVVIAEKECGITFHRAKKREEAKIIKEYGYLDRETYVNINPDVCEFCLECTQSTGCPGLAVTETMLGPKLETDLTWCVSDGACSKRVVCPAFEEVTVFRNQKPVRVLEHIDTRKDVPPPPQNRFDGDWKVYIAGVGGMGIGLITAILVRAGLQEGHRVVFSEKKGLAIRNGGVYSHIIFTKSQKPISPIIPYGKANVLIGLDILEATRSLDAKINLRVGSPQVTAAIVNTDKTPTVSVLTGKDDFDVKHLQALLRSSTDEKRFFGVDISDLSERLLGNKVHANLILLGVAFQRGELPVSLKSILAAIEMTVKPTALQENIKAFEVGRKIATAPHLFEADVVANRLSDMIAEKKRALKRHRIKGRSFARQFEQMVEDAQAVMKLEDEVAQRFAYRVYELIEHTGIKYAKRYIQRVLEVWKKDRADLNWEVTRAVIDNLFKVMAIKDEPYVAYLLTREEKRRRDEKRYNINRASGDRVVYRHFNRLEFSLGNRMFQKHLRTQDWMLSLVKKLRFMRKLLPLWHRRERQFRDWYETLVDQFRYGSSKDYQVYLEILDCPREVRGYREIRYPKMEQARQRVKALQNQLSLGNKSSPEPQVVKIYR